MIVSLHRCPFYIIHMHHCPCISIYLYYTCITYLFFYVLGAYLGNIHGLIIAFVSRDIRVWVSCMHNMCSAFQLLLQFYILFLCNNMAYIIHESTFKSLRSGEETNFTYLKTICNNIKQYLIIVIYVEKF